MKSIFYVGAALMIGATVYGFVDYRKSKSTKEFNELYTTKELTNEVVKPEPAKFEEIAPARPEETKVAFSDEQEPAKVEKTKVSMIDKKAASAKIEKTETAVIDEKVPVKTKVVKRNKHGKKKLTTKLFSRAAPPREVIEREPAKVEKH